MHERTWQILILAKLVIGHHISILLSIHAVQIGWVNMCLLSLMFCLKCGVQSQLLLASVTYLTVFLKFFIGFHFISWESFEDLQVLKK